VRAHALGHVERAQPGRITCLDRSAARQQPRHHVAAIEGGGHRGRWRRRPRWRRRVGDLDEPLERDAGERTPAVGLAGIGATGEQ